jgi:hypothetical protein
VLCVWYQPQQAGHYTPEHKFPKGGWGYSRPDVEEPDKELERLLNLADARKALRDMRAREVEINAQKIENLELARAKQAQKQKQLDLEKAAQQFGAPMITRKAFEETLGVRQSELDEPKKQEREQEAHAKRLYNIELARLAKEAEKERQAEIAEQRLKNLAKARKTLSKKRRGGR